MWTVEFVRQAEKELEKQPLDIQNRLDRIIGNVETYGFDHLPRGSYKSLGNGRWEFRIRGRDQTSRAVYVTKNERVIILYIFKKEKNKLTKHQWDIIEQREKEIPN